MPKKTFLQFAWLFLLVSSCTQTKELEMKPGKPTLVLNGLLTHDSIIRLQLSSTSGMIGKRSETGIDNAQVGLEENGVFKEWMVAEGKGIYRSDVLKYPVSGNVYSVHASASGFESVHSTDKLPQRVTVKESSYISNAVFDPKENYSFDEATVGFDDPPGQNYYELVILRQMPVVIPGQGMTNQVYLEPLTYWKCEDPILKAEGDLDYNPKTLIFSDNLFDGKSCKLKILINSASIMFVVLRNVSYDYYLYSKRWARHNFNKGPNPFSNRLDDLIFDMLFKGDPIDMFSNVKSGYGIWACYAASKLEMIEKKP